MGILGIGLPQIMLIALVVPLLFGVGRVRAVAEQSLSGARRSAIAHGIPAPTWSQMRAAAIVALLGFALIRMPNVIANATQLLGRGR